MAMTFHWIVIHEGGGLGAAVVEFRPIGFGQALAIDPLFQFRMGALPLVRGVGHFVGMSEASRTNDEMSFG